MIYKSMIYMSNKKDLPKTWLINGDHDNEMRCLECGELCSVHDNTSEYGYFLLAPQLEGAYYGPPESKTYEHDEVVIAYHGYSSESINDLASIKHIYRQNSWFGRGDVYYTGEKGFLNDWKWYTPPGNNYRPLQSMTDDKDLRHRSSVHYYWDESEKKLCGELWPGSVKEAMKRNN